MSQIVFSSETEAVFVKALANVCCVLDQLPQLAAARPARVPEDVSPRRALIILECP